VIETIVWTGKLQRVKAPIVIGARLCKGQYFDGVMDTVRELGSRFTCRHRAAYTVKRLTD